MIGMELVERRFERAVEELCRQTRHAQQHEGKRPGERGLNGNKQGKSH
jgi:hypothetical protein